MNQKVYVLWIFSWIICFLEYSSTQSQNAIGAHRVFDKTSFTCVGRPAGYYADIETGCQVYHMCDGLGRQFSYSCPNTTLFQQRMLICDHWYMVNCSKAESDYAANLLIGQRDKPFVPDNENHLRTPRPDLLDRPYAPDYSGESYRSQYKNEIVDTEKRFEVQPMATKWSIRQPSSFILPPAPPKASSVKSANNFDRSNQQPIASIRPVLLSNSNKLLAKEKISTTVHSTLTSTSRYSDQNKSTKFTSVTRSQAIINQNEVIKSDEDDLGTSFSLRYNTSADILADRGNKNFERKNSIPQNSKDTQILPPSRVYEPPFLYPIYNENYEEETLEIQHLPSTKMVTTNSVQSTIFPGRPFKKATFTTSTTLPTSTRTKYKNVEDNDKKLNLFSELNTTASPTIPIEQFTTTPTLSSLTDNLDYNILKERRLVDPSPFVLKNVEPQISLHLLPPFEELILHDTATTQGPPIYYEWKIPSNALQPPKSDPPIGVDGRKEDDKAFFLNTNSAKPDVQNLNLTSNTESNQRTNDLSTSRSIKNSSTTLSSPRLRKATNKTNPSNFTTDNEIQQLKKDLLIPEFLFPLESVGRTGYEHSDTVNSFQLKIPEKQIKNKNSWYGENPQCPECHPSFVKPGSCEPCIKR